jgi:hypothetical protein
MNSWSLVAASAAKEREALSDTFFSWDLKRFALWYQMPVSAGGAPCDVAPCGSRRLLEQQLEQRTRGQPQQQQPEQP